MRDLSFVWLEITGKCQLNCEHCYAESGPTGTDGAMRPDDWLRVIDEAVQAGATMVQFIGGEPTMHRSLPDLVDHALSRKLAVEVFSNLVYVSARLWEVFAQPGVRLATSYYSDIAREHEVITSARGSYARSKANIVEAIRRSIPLRVGVIDIRDGQRVRQARAELATLGVSEVRVDRLRHVGRGRTGGEPPDLSQLCGHCGRGTIAVAADGEVWPCVQLTELIPV